MRTLLRTVDAISRFFVHNISTFWAFFLKTMLPNHGVDGRDKLKAYFATIYIITIYIIQFILYWSSAPIHNMCPWGATRRGRVLQSTVPKDSLINPASTASRMATSTGRTKSVEQSFLDVAKFYRWMPFLTPTM